MRKCLRKGGKRIKFQKTSAAEAGVVGGRRGERGHNNKAGRRRRGRGKGKGCRRRMTDAFFARVGVDGSRGRETKGLRESDLKKRRSNWTTFGGGDMRKAKERWDWKGILKLRVSHWETQRRGRKMGSTIKRTRVQEKDTGRLLTNSNTRTKLKRRDGR